MCKKVQHILFIYSLTTFNLNFTNHHERSYIVGLNYVMYVIKDLIKKETNKNTL